jgi:hypothetical protein
MWHPNLTKIIKQTKEPFFIPFVVDKDEQKDADGRQLGFFVEMEHCGPHTEIYSSAKSFFGYEWNDQIEAFVNTLETVIQLHAEYGIDITTKPYIRGIQDTFWAGTCDLV